MMRSFSWTLTLAIGALAACTTTTVTNPGSGTNTQTPAKCTDSAQCAAGKETCDVPTGQCVAIPAGTEIGTGDGTATSVTFTEIYASEDPGAQLTDLAFSGNDPTQLWVLSYRDDEIHLGTGVTADSKGTFKRYLDPAAMHFMHKPPAIVWGAGGFWGTCGDNDNSQNDPRKEPNYFMGPAMFTSDLTIFAKQTPPPGGTNLGSHYDMLHNTTFCRGITHVEDNWYWVFNGELGSLDKYNFATPHEPGGDDHSDGEIYRYAEGQVKGVDGLSSHLAYDPADKFLYVADTGNKRIVRLDTSKGTLGGRLPRRNEILAKQGIMEDTSVEEIVAPGTLGAPTGIEVRNDHIYVSDASTSAFYVFDKQGTLVRTLETGLKAKSLSGFTFGPDNKIWFTDRVQSKVFRIDPITP